MFNYFDKIKETLTKRKEEINKIKEKIEPDKLKEKINPIIKTLKENNNVNKETVRKLSERFSFIYSNKIKEMDKFAGSNSFWQYYYRFKNTSKKSFSSFKSDPFNNSKSAIKDFFSFKKTLFVGSLKKRLKAIGFKLFLIYLGYLGIKILYHRAINYNTYGNPYQTVKELEEIKRQNDEILRKNRELIEENKRLRGY